MLRLEPAAADAHERLGALLEKLGRASEAAGHYGASAGLQPASARAQLALGNALYGQVIFAARPRAAALTGGRH